MVYDPWLGMSALHDVFMSKGMVLIDVVASFDLGKELEWVRG